MSKAGWSKVYTRTGLTSAPVVGAGRYQSCLLWRSVTSIEPSSRTIRSSRKVPIGNSATVVSFTAGTRFAATALDDEENVAEIQLAGRTPSTSPMSSTVRANPPTAPSADHLERCNVLISGTSFGVKLARGY